MACCGCWEDGLWVSFASGQNYVCVHVWVCEGNGGMTVKDIPECMNGHEFSELGIYSQA